MKITIHDSGVAISANEHDTYEWAHEPGNVWPCSELSGRKFSATFDTNGLVELDAPNVEDIPGDEFNAFTSDMLRDVLPEDHPCWFVTVGQFI